MKTINDLLEVMKEHALADRLVQGNWISSKGDDGIFQGCFYGCAMQTEDEPIEAACEMYNMPLWVGYWSEKVFEGLPSNKAMKWPVQLLEAMTEFNGDYEDIRHKLAVKRLTYLSERSDGEVKDAIEGVIEYHKTRDEDSLESVLLAAESAGWSAAEESSESAVWSATESEGESEGESAAKSAAWSAGFAARSVARSAGFASVSEAELAAWQRERDWMLELLKEQGYE